jgi:hypothetical protein
MQATVRADATPAIGDIDGDGLVDIVSITRESDWHIGYLIAFEHDGRVKWMGDMVSAPSSIVGIDLSNIALADMNNDGEVEILVGQSLYDHLGHLLWTAPGPSLKWAAPTAADLDGNGDLEMVLGHAAYRYDGSEYYLNAQVSPGFPQVADMDGDGLPEILITGTEGLSMLAHDGTPIFINKAPSFQGVPGPSYLLWPSAVADLDGDGLPELISPTSSAVTAVTVDGSVRWSAPSDDRSGLSGLTAFDFFGDGTSEVLYGDEHKFYVFGSDGKVLFSEPHPSNTALEYPVVADVDNDGSAEFIVVTDVGLDVPRAPAVQVFRDKQDRWKGARRIWNEYTYHVTNVNEDGTIPRNEAPSWKQLNTFRTNASVGGTKDCGPSGPE